MSAKSARDGPPVPKRPSAEDFTGGAVQRAVLKETLQHPGAIIPWALAIGGALFTALTHSPELLLATLGLAGVGTAFWGVQYFGRGEALAENHVRRLREQQEQADDERINEIQEQCRAAGWGEGAKEAGELIAAYRGLKETLAQKASGSSRVRLEDLSDQALSEGIDILQRGLETFRAVSRVDVQRLQRERTAWQKELLQLPASAESQRRALEEKISAHTRTIDFHAERTTSLEEVIARVNDIGNTLERATLSAPSGEVSDLFNLGGAASELATAVEASRRLEQRLRGIAQGNATPEDAEYGRIGKELRGQAAS